MRPRRIAIATAGLMIAAAVCALVAWGISGYGSKPGGIGERRKSEVGSRQPPAVDSLPSIVAQRTTDHGQAPINRASLHEAIASMTQYLVRVTGEDGKFVYRINLDPRVKPREIYNEIRHAGAIYSLADAQLWRPNAETLNAMLRSARFLKTQCLEPVPGRDGMLAAWTKPEFSGSTLPKEAKLGGAGLALVALLSAENVKPGETPLEDLRGLGRFLLMMQKRDGGFHSKYLLESGPDDRFMSLYYPGEAALGLVMLYEKDPNPEWINAAARAMAYLAEIRKGKSSVEADHWALLATARLLPLYDNSDGAVPREVLIAHAVQVCESMLAEKAYHAPHSIAFGCFTDDGRTTPTATRLEGLQAALSVLPPEQDILRQRIEAAVADGIDFLLRSRVDGGQYDGGVPKAIRSLPPGHPRNRGSFNSSSGEVRIDYVQHALSAMLAYDRRAYDRVRL